MSWFTKKVTDPVESFSRLASPDKKTSDGAKEEFVGSLNGQLVQFLIEQFDENQDQQVRLRILEIFGARSDIITGVELKEILRFIMLPDPLLRETFKEILKNLDEERLKPVTDLLISTTDVAIRNILQYAIEHSGILETFVKKWGDYTTKDKLVYVEQIVLLQNPKLFPIFFDVLKEETQDSKKEEKKTLQAEFARHLDKIKDPAFMELAVKQLNNIDGAMWYAVMKAFQVHGAAFFKKLFEGFERKNEAYRHKVMQILEQLADPNSYPFLFPFLLDRQKLIPPVVQSAIGSIVKRFTDELEAMSPDQRTTQTTLDRIEYFVKPLENSMTEQYVLSFKVLTESLLRISRYHQETILRNLPRIHKHNLPFFLTYLKGLEKADRKDLLINACCFPDIETGKTAVALLSDPSENYIVETLNTLLLEKFLQVPQPIQVEIIALMMDPRLKRFVEEVLSHNDAEVRCRILQILGESGAPNALAALVSKMRDPDTVVRVTILKLLKLPQFQNDLGTEALIEFLKDTDIGIVQQTIDLLRERDNPKILQALTKLMATRDPKIRDLAHKAIASITRRKFLNSFNQMSAETRLAVANSLIKMDTAFLEDMTRDLSASDQKTRVMAARVLEVLVDHIPPDVKTNLIVATQDPDPEVRGIVVMCLGKIGGPAVGGLMLGFLKDVDDRVRANAIEALGLVGDPQQVSEIQPLLKDRSNRVRANAITTLWKLGYYQIYDSILEMMRHTDKWMRASAAFALGELNDKRFIPVLIQCLRDADPDVRRNTIRSLARLAEPGMIAPYVRGLRFDQDEGVRKVVNDVLLAACKPPTPAAPHR